MAFRFTLCLSCVDFLKPIGEDYTNSVQSECRHVSQEVEEGRLLIAFAYLTAPEAKSSFWIMTVRTSQIEFP